MTRSRKIDISVVKPLAVSITALTLLGTVGYAQTISAQDVTIRTLHSFDRIQGNFPVADLLQVADGSFYGTTRSGGTGKGGIIYKITPSGAFTTVFAFNNSNGGASNTLMQATDGNFYGTTQGGGEKGRGTIFRLTPAGKLTTLYSFVGSPGLNNPTSKLVQGADGALYGTTYGDSRGGLVFKVTLSGKLTPLHEFISQTGTGDFALAGLTLASDGSFYGVSTGAVFRLRPNGKYAVLHTFDGRYGRVAFGGLTEGPDGFLYGTTATGGPNTDSTHQGGYGTIFKISKTGQFTTLHAFGPDLHGALPESKLALGPDGNFYGTTFEGGFDPQTGKGTVFQMTPEGVVTTLYKFDGGLHGGSPFSGVTFGTDGALYGTTESGSVPSASGSTFGTIFKLTLP